MYIFGFTRAVNLPRSVRRVPRSAAVALAAIAVAAVVASCAAPGGPRSDDLVCNSPQQCRVTVRVDCTPGCTASVDHPQVLARGNDIVWIVANKPGQSYVFRAQGGVSFKTEAGRNVFSCHREAAGERYACMNRKTPGRYEYGIALDGSPPVPVLDPWVVN